MASSLPGATTCSQGSEPSHQGSQFSGITHKMTQPEPLFCFEDDSRLDANPPQPLSLESKLNGDGLWWEEGATAGWPINLTHEMKQMRQTQKQLVSEMERMTEEMIRMRRCMETLLEMQRPKMPAKRSRSKARSKENEPFGFISLSQP